VGVGCGREGGAGAAGRAGVRRDRWATIFVLVMAGRGPAIHVLTAAKTWMPGTSPGMTWRENGSTHRAQGGIAQRIPPQLVSASPISPWRLTASAFAPRARREPE